MLDFNPKYFAVILDWLRHGKVWLDAGVGVDNVNEMAVILGLNDMVEAIEKKKAGEEVVIEKEPGEGKKEEDWEDFNVKICNGAYTAISLDIESGGNDREVNNVPAAL